MADDWFKLNMDIFGNRKIKFVRRLPDGDSIALFWIALLAEARRCNSDGKIFLTENIPYTEDVLAEDFKFDENTVKSALEAFKQLDMIYMDNGFITITGWEDHQNAEGLAKIREQNRQRQAKYKAKQKEASSNSEVTLPITLPITLPVTLGNATEKERESERESDIKNKIHIDCQQIVDLYHSICKSFPSVRSLSDARKKAIKARLKTYTIDDFRKVFENAEASSFLKGVDGGWKASFDWLIKEANMLKVLEGNYADKPKRYGRKEPVPGWMPFEPGEAELEAIRRVMREDPVTVGNSPELAERAEQLRQQLQEG